LNNAIASNSFLLAEFLNYFILSLDLQLGLLKQAQQLFNSILFVDLRRVFYSFGPMPEPQRSHCLCLVVKRR